MKRFYHLAIFKTVAVGVLALGLGLSAVAEDWHVIKKGSAVTPEKTVKPAELTDVQKVLRKHGKPFTDSKLQPAVDGYQDISGSIMRAPGTLTRTMENPRGNLFGILSRFEGMESASQSALLKFDTRTMTANKLFTGSHFFQANGNIDNMFEGLAYHDGLLYVPTRLVGVADTEVRWNVVDFATGQLVDVIDFTGQDLSNAYSLVWHPKREVFYGLSVTQADYNELVKIDLKNKKVTDLGYVGNGRFIAALVYNPNDDTIYAFDEENSVWQVNIEDGIIDKRLTGEAPLDIDFSFFPITGGAGLITYSPMDQCYLALYFDNRSNSYILYSFDPDTYEVNEVGTILKGYNTVSSLICTDDLADEEAPELPEASLFNFTDASLSGKITVKVPETTYYGLIIPESTNVRTVVNSDGKEILNTNLKAGQTYTFDVTLTEGLHIIETICYIGDYRSPVRSQKLYVGNDTPTPPSDINLNGNRLSWRAPRNKGVNNGYVDVKALTYDVFMDGVKQNSEPITVTSYALDKNVGQSVHQLSVKASANGHTSEAASINRVFGKALNLPLSMKPSKEESELFTIGNPTDDAFAWMFTTNTNDESETGMVYPMSLYKDADDWLILPLINFPDESVLYQYCFDVKRVRKKDTDESFDVFLGKTTNYYDFSNKLYGIDSYRVTDVANTVVVNFAVPEPGDYYLAIHCRSTHAFEGGGMFTTNHVVRALDGQSSAVPGQPTDIEVVAAPKAALALDVTLTLPTVDLIGNPLPADQVLTVKGTCGELTGKATGKPGERVKFSSPIPELGWNILEIAVSNENGEGIHSTFRRYAGPDIPLCPVNIKSTTAEDNMSMTLTWDSPGEVGANGGYVDPATLTYDIYMRTGSLNVYQTVAKDVKGNKFTFPAESDKLTNYVLAPVAVSPGGPSSNSMFVKDFLGKPFEAPINEEFNTTGFTYGHTNYIYDRSGEYGVSTWENLSNCSNYVPGCQEKQGALMCFSSEGPGKGRLNLPKITTAGIKSGLLFKIRYYDYASAPENITLWVRHSKDQELKPLKTYKTNRPILSSQAKWEEATFELPAEVHDNSWVQFAIECSLSGNSNQFFMMDSYTISPDVLYDVKVNEFTIPSQVVVGDKLKVMVPIYNVGKESSKGKLTFDLCKPDGKVVESRSVAFSIPPYVIQERNILFDINGDFSDCEKLLFRAHAELDETDEVPQNNTRTVEVNVLQNNLPVVSTLKGEVVEENASLTWQTPSTEYGGREDFENDTPFLITETIGAWKNIDLDKLPPATIGSGNLVLSFPDSEKPSAWTVIDPSKTVFKDDPRLQAHSGNQFILARPLYIESEESQQLQASDWLISPELAIPTDGKGNQLGTKLDFWFNTIASDEKEFIYIWVSFTGDNLDPSTATQTRNGDFTRLRPFSKVGEAAWEHVEYDLPVGVKYVAIVYSSYAAVGAMLDDITITPAKYNTWEIDHYAIYRDNKDFGMELIKDNLTDLSYLDNEYKDLSGGAKYYVVTYVKLPDGSLKESPKSNVADLSFDVSSVGAVETLEGIATGNGRIIFYGYENKTLNVYTTDGKLVGIVRPTSSLFSAEFGKGVYVVTEGSRAAKVIVK